VTALANFRDVADAHPGLIAGVYYRSDAPAVGDAPPTAAVWPPATVFDLRDPGESHGPHPLADVSDVHQVRLFADASVERMLAGDSAPSLTALYALLIESPQAEALVGVIRGIASSPGPVLAHCSAGKDRAGVTTALVLALLGVPREEIVADYVATAPNMRGVLERFFRAMPAELAAEASESGALEAASGLLEAPADAIEHVLDAWDAHDGGVTGWFLAHGGDAETISALRARLVAPGAGAGVVS
jgi:protein-tyrosine phosphatase